MVSLSVIAQVVSDKDSSNVLGRQMLQGKLASIDRTTITITVDQNPFEGIAAEP